MTVGVIVAVLVTILAATALLGTHHTTTAHHHVSAKPAHTAQHIDHGKKVK